MPLTIQIIKGSQINHFLQELASLRITVFREYPYLYDGSFEYEYNYLKTYTDCEESILVLALNDQEHIVGASTGIPLKFEIIEFQTPFLRLNENIENFFYCGESILLPEYRGKGIYPQFFKAREVAAKESGCLYTTFCAVDNPDASMKPDSYRDLTGFWRQQDYVKRDDLQATFEWKQINEDKSSPKKLTFWIKQL